MRKLIVCTAAVLAAGAAWAQPATYAIDPTHTFATFEISHFGTSTNRGRWDKKEGTVQFDRAGKSGRVELTIDVASINTGTAAFDKHLRGPDFFDVEKYPTARFVGERFVFQGDKVSEVGGTLTLMGKTHPVTLKATHFNCYQHPMLKREICGGDFETTIDRSLYGINYGLQFGFPKEVRVVIQVEAVKQ
jgi:polyisoprenoid-binding protein YceI